MDGEKVLLLSFSKSGSNWVRYCIEHFSAMRTPGSKRVLLHAEGPAIIDRAHFVEHWHRVQLQANQRPAAGITRSFGQATGLSVAWARLKGLRKRGRGIGPGRRILLLLRDPLEVYVRVRATRPRALIGYVGNILAFECRREAGLCVHYEDLMAPVGERVQLSRILDFLDIDHDVASFDLDRHRQRSLELYDRGEDRAVTRGSLEASDRHANRLSGDEIAAIERYLRGELGPEPFERYLGRYFADRDRAGRELGSRGGDAG